MMKKEPLLLLFTVTVIILTLALASSSSSIPFSDWQILTNYNFTSQIQLHPHILLLVTIPWCGESRSLMKDVSLAVVDRVEEFGTLKLMFMHRNTEKILADSIGASSEGITLFYFHYSVSYKYRGRLSARNLLSSLQPYMSLAPEEVPLKALNTPEDFRAFVDSADKALVLVDFCGWTPKLLAKSRKNGTENGFSLCEEHMCSAELSINNGNGFCQSPWQFASVNDGPLEASKDTTSHVLYSCSPEEFERFHSFYLKFMTAVREFFLPPERHRFGLVSDRSMLPSLDVGESGSWFAVLFQAGCSSCLNILKEEDDLNYILQMNNYFVKELEVNGHDREPTLPANKPSVLLFIDRSSDSSKTRRRSKEALDAFRVLAQHYHVANQTGKKISVLDYCGLKSKSEHPRLKLSMMAQKIKLKEKLSSIMIVNEGKQVSLDDVASNLQVSSLNEILGYLLQQKKERKLSSIAKDLGFQLLSDDMDIKSANTQHPPLDVQSNQIFTETSQEGLKDDTVKQDDGPHRSAIELEDDPKLNELSSQNDKVDTPIIISNEMKYVQSEETVIDHELPTANSMKSETDDSSDENESGKVQSHFLGFNGSFLYSDGNYQLLESLTGGSIVPSLVIVDPFWQQHFVYREVENFNFSSLHGFLSEFLNGTLLPYQQSEHVLQDQREATRPPFVNLDFHETDSIPRITSHSFSQLVIGFNLSNKENISNAWNKDVLVLFSNSWCAFCQRMEMIVREVYRAIKGYMDVLKSGSWNLKGISDHESSDYVKTKLPIIYLLDCTLNDCSLILKSVNQGEVFPALILFPAEKKEAVLYEGDMAVIDVMKFVAEHGSNFHHLTREKVLWHSEGVGKNQDFYDTLEADIKEESLHMRNKYIATPVHGSMEGPVTRPDSLNSPALNELHETLPNVVIGSVLIATEKLSGAQPFDGAKILIVAADQISGFQGLIINKNLQWSVLPELVEGFEKLKEAPLFLGGPVMKPGMPLSSLTRKASANPLTEILPGIHFLHPATTNLKIEELKSENQPVSDYWFFLGFSNWGWNQLYDEIAQGAWNLSNDGMKHLNWQ